VLRLAGVKDAEKYTVQSLRAVARQFYNANIKLCKHLTPQLIKLAEGNWFSQICCVQRSISQHKDHKKGTLVKDHAKALQAPQAGLIRGQKPVAILRQANMPAE